MVIKARVVGFLDDVILAKMRKQCNKLHYLMDLSVPVPVFKFSAYRFPSYISYQDHSLLSLKHISSG